MGDYANIGRDLIKAAGFVYILISFLAIGLALMWPKSIGAKAIATVIVIALASILPIQGLQELRAQQAKADEFKQRFTKAKALFEERCKTAGEKIYRTVEGVEGIAITKIRPKTINFGQQFALDDPYGQVSSGGQSYINTFLSGRKDEFWLTDDHALGAYKFVDLIESETSATRYRLKLEQSGGGKFERTITTESTAKPARYQVDWMDASSNTERQYWIACGAVKVSDRATGELLGERTGCMFDKALGATGGGRSPWAFARDTSCPANRLTPDGRAYHDPQDRNFVEKVLKPSKESK